MDSEPDTYEIESVEQLRGIADPLRLRIIDHISEQPMTVTQVGEALDEPANKVHYHMRELERLGLVRIVETREKSGILEKYYQTVARYLRMPDTLLRRVPRDENVETIAELVQAVLLHFTHAFQHAMRTQAWHDESISLEYLDLWMTPEEYREADEKMREVLKPYVNRQPGEGRRLMSFLHLSHPSPVPADQGARRTDMPAPRRARRPKELDRSEDLGVPARSQGMTIVTGTRGTSKTRRVVIIGSISYSRLELERMLAAGLALDLTVFGRLTVSPDVPPGLAEAVIAKLRHRGTLHAAPEVRAILQQKGARASV